MNVVIKNRLQHGGTENTETHRVKRGFSEFWESLFSVRLSALSASVLNKNFC